MYEKGKRFTIDQPTLLRSASLHMSSQTRQTVVINENQCRIVKELGAGSSVTQSANMDLDIESYLGVPFVTGEQAWALISVA